MIHFDSHRSHKHPFLKRLQTAQKWRRNRKRGGVVDGSTARCTLSQLIYSLQNAYVNCESLKLIEKECFNYLWNKKPDKTKAFERISRKILKLPYTAGGINAPDIRSLNLALKIKQYIRSSSSENSHIIRELQSYVCNFDEERISTGRTHNKFMLQVKDGLSELLNIMISEIKENDGKDDCKLNKLYYDLIASENVASLNNVLNIPPIASSFIRNVSKDLGIRYVGQLINEYKFPSSDNHIKQVQFIVNCNPIFKVLANRKMISSGHTYRDGIFLGTNNLIKMPKITTKLLKNRLLFGTAINVNIPQFTNLKKITHPKEREVEFFRLHNVILSGAKLFEMKLILSPLCPICDSLQTSDHIFTSCTNALLALECLDKNSHLINKKFEPDIKAMINRILFIRKDKKINEQMFQHVISNRILDCEQLLTHKDITKQLNLINKITLI